MFVSVERSAWLATIGAWWIFNRNMTTLSTSSRKSPREINAGKYWINSQTDVKGRISNASSMSLKFNNNNDVPFFTKILGENFAIMC